jgi:hypothetical protein
VGRGWWLVGWWLVGWWLVGWWLVAGGLVAACWRGGSSLSVVVLRGLSNHGYTDTSREDFYQEDFVIPGI